MVVRDVTPSQVNASESYVLLFNCRDKRMADQIRQKIQSMESYRERLKTSEKTMENHQLNRSKHKKMTVF